MDLLKMDMLKMPSLSAEILLEKTHRYSLVRGAAFAAFRVLLLLSRSVEAFGGRFCCSFCSAFGQRVLAGKISEDPRKTKIRFAARVHVPEGLRG
jgi:hypothetical protein